MGLLDSLAGNLMNAASGGNASQGGGLMQVITGLLGSSQGGLSGLVQAFEGQGLGNIIQSWISTGANLPISADQLQSVLGGDKLQSIAQSLGVSSDEAAGQLSNMLPQVIDQLTPNGTLPSAEGLGGLLGGLGNLLGGGR